MLNVHGLTVKFGDFTAVDDVTVELPTGRVLAILGPSGCGKSTLLRAIAGLVEPHAGAVSFDGQDLASVPTHRRGFALMFQDGQLFPQQSVAANVGYALRLRSTPAATVATHVRELLTLVGLPDAGERATASLSGGEQQRVALARALAAKPKLLLLDEPLSALDRELRERLTADLSRILAQTGTTAVLVTHDHDEAFALADDVAVMSRGAVVQQGPTAQVWRSPVSAQMARFLGYSAVLQGEAADRVLAAVPAGHDGYGGHSKTSGMSGVDRTNGSAGLAIRRSALQIVEPSSQDDGRGLRGRVAALHALSDAVSAEVDINGVGTLSATVPTSASLRLRVGDQVDLTIDPYGLAVLPPDGQLARETAGEPAKG